MSYEQAFELNDLGQLRSGLDVVNYNRLHGQLLSCLLLEYHLEIDLLVELYLRFECIVGVLVVVGFDMRQGMLTVAVVVMRGLFDRYFRVFDGRFDEDSVAELANRQMCMSNFVDRICTMELAGMLCSTVVAVVVVFQ